MTTPGFVAANRVVMKVEVEVGVVIEVVIEAKVKITGDIVKTDCLQKAILNGDDGGSYDSKIGGCGEIGSCALRHSRYKKKVFMD
ncbi:6493_t:CDS:2 [Diversispora eburnea]|uniref:6493_t:CDS:1 n=1 Tax=Diversispora eburnea TaxID=1213867 RepID=A0A9N8V4Q4_9GLOM|nr:6493_t:CDS:2 [Diversispora eburnea]